MLSNDLARLNDTMDGSFLPLVAATVRAGRTGAYATNAEDFASRIMRDLDASARLRDRVLDLTRARAVALRDAARTRTFWVLFGTFFVCGASTNGLIQTHFIPLCADYGLGPVQAASALAAMGIFDFIGTTASGWLSDRYDNRWLLFWYYGLRGLSLAFLPFSGFSPSCT